MAIAVRDLFLMIDPMPGQEHSDTPAHPRPSTRHQAAIALGLVTALLACSPAFDWRSVRVPDTQLVTELPCRPSRFQRDEVVAGVPLKLFMLSCAAGGVTYGVATADVGDPARVDAVLFALRDGATAAIRSSNRRPGALNVSGATPFTGNSSAHLHGQRPDGETIDESIRVFARGTRVFQASAVGPSLPDSALRPFEDGLRFDLEKPAADPN